jgi:hypothetical protein
MRCGRLGRGALTRLVIGLLSLAGVASAQTTGKIEGRITDSSGASLPAVTVEAVSPSQQGVRTSTSARDGSYRLPALPPGNYAVRATLPGFRPAEKSALVSLDATATVDLTLDPAAEESVLVSGNAAAIDVTSTTTGTNYTSQVIAHLPVGRNYADVVKLNPGVIVDRGATQGRSLALSVYGSTSAENQWVIDGVNTTNVMKGIQGKAINAEFIQEVEVKSGGYQAEYGRALGGVINVVTKSGGNEFHGEAFVYYDSGALQASRVFVEGEDSPLSGMRLADYRRADFGVDFGGFLVRNRLWFFGAYDRVEFPAHVSRYVSSDLVPATMRFPLRGTDNLYSGKLTWNVAAGTSLVGTAFADPTTNSGAGRADPRQGSNIFDVFDITNPDPGTWETSRSIGATDFGIHGSQVLGVRGLVGLRAARHQDRYELVTSGAGSAVRVIDKTCEGGSRDSACEIPPEPNFVTGGIGFIWGPSSRSASHRDQVRADLNLYLKSHELKLGADYQRSRTTATTVYSGGQQVTRFNNYGEVYYEHDFFPRSREDLTPVDRFNDSGSREVGAYLQDSWKLAPGLTIDAGLRWDRERIQNYQNVSVIRFDNEWQPRLGVVWDPTRSGKMKLYVFGGRFYYSLPTEIGSLSFGRFTDATTFNFDPVGVTPDRNVYKHETSFVNVFTAGNQVDPALGGVYLDEYTVGVERQFGATLSVGLKATYRSLRHAVEDRCDLDWVGLENEGSQCAITVTGGSGQYSSGQFYYCTGLDDFSNCIEDPQKYVPLFGTAPVPRARRVYRGIELLARKDLSDRAWLQASYVFSSLRGNYDGAVNEGFGGQTDPGINADFDYAQLFHNNYGRLFLDRPHQLRLDGFYVTPFGLSVGLESWLRSGAPLSKKGFFNWLYATGIHLVPRGSVGRLPMEWDANLTVEYPIRFGPLTVTLQGFLYNVFNNQIPTFRDQAWSNQEPPDYPTSLYDPNQKQSNPYYGLVQDRSGQRLFRAAIRVSF